MNYDRNIRGTTVSVVIPAYNIADYIGRAIDSVLTQSRPAEEILVVDDGSTDNTAEAIKRYGARVTYIYQENRGLSGARNAGIQAAIGDWVAFLDGDDEWLPEKLRAQMDHVQRHPELVWADCNLFSHNCIDNTREITNDQDDVDDLLAGREYFDSYFTAANNDILLTGSTMIVRRDVFNETGLFNEEVRYAEDIDMWWRIAYRWKQLGYVNHPLAVYYQRRPGSLTADADRELIVRSIFEIFDRHAKLAAEHGMSDEITPFVTAKLHKWLCNAYGQKRRALIAEMLSQYGYLLTPGHRKLLGFLIRMPIRTTFIGKRILKKCMSDASI
ncbi:MAG: glycosyltransferase [Phycisphaerae bacterium]|nr:glycosyltransferase [Phycisphaerae bacterium]